MTNLEKAEIIFDTYSYLKTDCAPDEGIDAKSLCFLVDDTVCAFGSVEINCKEMYEFFKDHSNLTLELKLGFEPDAEEEHILENLDKYILDLKDYADKNVIISQDRLSFLTKQDDVFHLIRCRNPLSSVPLFFFKKVDEYSVYKLNENSANNAPITSDLDNIFGKMEETYSLTKLSNQRADVGVPMQKF